MRRGLCESLTIQCKNCSSMYNFKTSPRSSNKILAYDINIRSIYASQQIGRAGLSKFCNILDLAQPVTDTLFTHIQNDILEFVSKNTEKIMKDAAQRLLSITLRDDPQNITLKPNGEMICDVTVTVDGTWQRRGHSS